MARVLIIEDDSGAREHLKEMLEQAGYEVVAVSQGSEGLNLFRRRAAELVIVDIDMPGQSGFEVIQELNYDFPSLPILATSGSSGIRAGMLTKKAEVFGALRVLFKPLAPGPLLNAVSEALRRPE